jgi:hypothetical protein
MQQKKLRNYLEIGVCNGHVFFRVSSTYKLAVDPAFTFDTARKIGKTIVNPYNLFNRYFSKTSDAFFAEDAPQRFAKKPLQLALVDGLHEYAFALRDVENALKYLSDDGVIIMHDCNPQSKEEAGTLQEWRERGSGQWNGDVWKALLHLRSLRNDINVFVLDCDQGLGIVTKGKPESTLPFSADAISKLMYEQLSENRKEWLNLKPADYFYTYFGV